MVFFFHEHLQTLVAQHPELQRSQDNKLRDAQQMLDDGRLIVCVSEAHVSWNERSVLF
jgi:hypothetical protein